MSRAEKPLRSRFRAGFALATRDPGWMSCPAHILLSRFGFPANAGPTGGCAEAPRGPAGLRLPEQEALGEDGHRRGHHQLQIDTRLSAVPPGPRTASSPKYAWC